MFSGLPTSTKDVDFDLKKTRNKTEISWVVSLVYLMVYKLFMGYLKPKLDSFLNVLIVIEKREREVQRRERKKEWKKERKKSLVWFICLMAYQLFMGYLKPKLDSFLNVWSQSYKPFSAFIYNCFVFIYSVFLFVNSNNNLLLLKIFWLLTSSLLLYSQRFDRYVLRSSSGVSCRTRKPIQNLDLNPLFNPLG